MNWLILAVLLQSPAVVVPVDTSTDTREFAAYIKQPLPDIEADSGDVLLFDLKDFYAVGDTDVVGVAPTFTLGGTGCAGLTLTSTDKDNATYGGTATTVATGTRTITIDNDHGSAVVDSFGCAITASSVDPPLTASDYCVSAAGSDTGNDGHYPNCWKTIEKVNGFTFAAGANVYFRSGDTFTPTNQLKIDWSGSAGDRVKIDTFYELAGAAYDLGPTNPTANPMDMVYDRPRAIIVGSTKPSCRVDQFNHCPFAYDGSAYPGMIPANKNLALIQTAAYYVTVEDLESYGSAGLGVSVGVVNGQNGTGYFQGCKQSDAVCQVFVTIQRVKVDYCMANGMSSYIASSVVMRENEIKRCSLAWGDHLQTPTPVTNVGSPLGSAKASNILIENNWVHDDYGDGIACYSRFCLSRGNRVAAVDRAELMIMGYDDGVQEQNIAVGGAIIDAPYADASEGNSFWVMSSGLEAPGAPRDGAPQWGEKRVIFRNNLLHVGGATGQNSCLHDYISNDYPAATRGDRIDHKFIGNTCISTGTSKISTNDYNNSTDGGSPAAVTQWEAANNLWVNRLANDGSYSEPNLPVLTWHHNQWAYQPTNGGVRVAGTGDVYSTNTGLSGFDFSLVSSANFPDEDDFLPSGGAGSGVASLSDYTSTGWILSDGEWDWVLSQRQWLPDCNTTGAQVPPSVWEQDAATDYCGNPRAAGSDIGARDY